MFIYNVTINVSEEMHYKWLGWMKETHIPEVMKTGCFIDNQVLKVLYVEDEGHTYSVQYKFLEMVDIENYQTNFAPVLRAQQQALFGEHCIAFRTILQIID